MTKAHTKIKTAAIQNNKGKDKHVTGPSEKLLRHIPQEDSPRPPPEPHKLPLRIKHQAARLKAALKLVSRGRCTGRGSQSTGHPLNCRTDTPIAVDTIAGIVKTSSPSIPIHSFNGGERHL